MMPTPTLSHHHLLGDRSLPDTLPVMVLQLPASSCQWLTVGSWKRLPLSEQPASEEG